MNISTSHIKGVGYGISFAHYLNFWICGNGVLITYRFFNLYNNRFLIWPWQLKKVWKIHEKVDEFFRKYNYYYADNMLRLGASDEVIEHATGLENWSKTSTRSNKYPQAYKLFHHN